MKEFTSETHKAVISSDGLLKVMQLSPHQVRVTASTPDGGVQVYVLDKNTASGADQRMLMAKDNSPVFVAGYCGGSQWTVDLDCGAQRWRGEKSSKEMSEALTNCGFDPATKKQIMSECHKHKCDFVPWYNG
jgi:hypothetical protein